MSGREWKPGDVGVSVKWGYRGMYVANYCRSHNRQGCWHNESGLADAPDDVRRPLVVIDPEDREQAERLALALDRTCINVTGVQRALRSLIEPEKPAEPTGLGAVVEDAEGTWWVRYERLPEHAAYHWHNSRGACRWDEIAAVKVLSEGVAPAEAPLADWERKLLRGES